MKIIKTLAVLLLIQGTVFSQTLQDAKKAIESEFYFKAKKILLPLNTTAPTVETNYYLGNVYLITGKVDSAKFYYKKASEIEDNKNPLKYVAMGKLNLLDNKPEEAKESFNTATKVSKSKNAEIFYQIGDAYYKINNEEALKYYELAYYTDPNLIINLLAYGDAYLDMNNPGQAMNRYEQARAINPNIAVIHLRIGRVNAKTGKHKEAIDAFEKTVALDPNLAVAWKELGEEYYLDGQLTKVRGSFDKYIELNAEDKEARVVTAVTCYQIGDYICAIEESRKILIDDPNNFIAWRIIFYSNFELGDTLRKTDPVQSTAKFNEGYEAVKSFWNIPEKKIQPMDYQYSARLAVEV
ncbi:MAG: tetratricopeptide repeat protein, partial [Chitinophagales bacterium]